MLNCNYFFIDGMSIILDICEKWIECDAKWNRGKRDTRERGRWYKRCMARASRKTGNWTPRVQNCLCNGVYASRTYFCRGFHTRVYPHIFEISIFHFRVARYSCRTDATTERVGICNTCFRVRRVSHGFRFTLTYIILVRHRFQRQYHQLVFSPSYFALQPACSNLYKI